MEGEVRNAPPESVGKLDAAELNRIIKLRAESGPVPYGKVYELSGVARRVSIGERTEKNDSEWVRLDLSLPDYAAATVECHFALAQKPMIAANKAGQTLTVRGKLDRRLHFSDGTIALTGCVIVSP